MMTKEQLDKIKQLHEMSEEYPEHKNVIDVELLRKGVPALIEEVERLQGFEQKAIYAIEENRKLREAITQALEAVSDVEGELIERVERVLLDALKGADNDGA